MEDNYVISGPISQKIISEIILKIGKHKDAGGNMLFIGQVRADESEGKRVKAIEYSAYTEMVSAEAEKIKQAIFSEFDDVKAIEVVHSTGVVRAGEISLLVLVCSGHRQQAMQACSKTVELIKANLPVWKKEIYEDDSHIWK
jgi:molybdopterin synthase catalytic subunit